MKFAVRWPERPTSSRRSFRLLAPTDRTLHRRRFGCRLVWHICFQSEHSRLPRWRDIVKPLIEPALLHFQPKYEIWKFFVVILSLAIGLLGWLPVSNAIPDHARHGVGHHVWRVPFPGAVPRPVPSELVNVSRLPKDDEIGLSADDILDFGVRHSRLRRAVGMGQAHVAVVQRVRWKDHIEVAIVVVRNWGNRWRILKSTISKTVCMLARRAGLLPTFVTLIPKTIGVAGIGWSYVDWQRDLHLEPRALFSFKIVLQIPPLDKSHNSVDYPGGDSEALQCFPEANPLPPFKGCVLGIRGIGGIIWGWGNDRRMPWSIFAFFIRVVLWTWASLVLLPWAVRF